MNPTHKKRIFVYIRTKLVSNALNFILTDNGFQVSCFNAQKDLLAQVSQTTPDVILFDFKSIKGEDESDLEELYMKLKLSFKDIPIVLLFSSDMRDSIKTLFRSARPDAILKKPFKLMELLEKLHKLLYSGDLKDYPFPLLIQTFYDERRTGVLHITVEGTKYFIYFIDGQIVYIEYGLRKDTLGMLLLRQGMITEKQYNSALTDAAKNNNRLGISLINLGFLSPSVLNDALEMQVHEKILNCFADNNGTFSFKFQDRFIDDIVIYKKDQQALIFEGVKRHYGSEKFVSFFNTIKSQKFRIKSEMIHDLDIFRFNTDELKITAKLKSLCTYDELALKEGFDKLLLLQVLYTLSLTRFLLIAGKDEEVKEDARHEELKEVKEDKAAPIPVEIKDSELTDEICEAYIKIKSMNYYEVFGVPRDADTHTIKKIYTTLAKKFHPDKFSQEGSPDLVDKATEIFTKLTNAFHTLIDEAARNEYDYKIDHPKEAEILSSANEIIQSETEFMKGVHLLKQKNHSDAEQAFDTAMQLNPREPEYKCYLAWAHFLNPTNEKEEKVAFAKRLIAEAMSENQNIERAYYFLGAIAKYEGDLPLAIKHYKQSLKMDPENAETKIQLRVLQSREEK